MVLFSLIFAAMGGCDSSKKSSVSESSTERDGAGGALSRAQSPSGSHSYSSWRFALSALVQESMWRSTSFVYFAVTVSMNEPEEHDAVLAFLQRNQATMENLLTEYGAGEGFVKAFELPGEIPYCLLIDQQGKIRFRFSGEPEGMKDCESLDQIEVRIEELLGGK